MKLDDPLKSSKLKLKQAKEHIQNLEHEIARFFHRRPYRVFDNPISNGTFEIAVELTDPLPDKITTLCGDAISNLFAVLDHAVAAISRLDGLGDAGCAFPIGNDAAEFFVALQKGKLKKFPSNQIDILAGFQAYPNGFGDPIWRLKKLEQVNKHREYPAIGLVHAGSRMTTITNGFRNSFGCVGGQWNNSEKRMVLMKFDTPFWYEVDVSFHVVFDKVEPVDRHMVIRCLNEAATVVELVVGECEQVFL